MNRRLLGVFAFALAVASITSLLAYRLISGRVQPAPSNAVPSSRLVVAAHDLQVGALIGDTDLQEVAWAGPIPDQALRAKTDVVGRGVISTIYQGEPFLQQRLAAKGAGAGMASTIPVGKRAVAIRVNDVVGLAGFVLPGMRVDVLVAGNLPGPESAGNTRCRTVLQNIEVLSAGQRIDQSQNGKPETAEVVNLLVTPDQAETLNLASTETKLQLVLRNPLDTKEAETHGASVAALFGMKDAPAPVARLPLRAASAPPPAPLPVQDTVEVFSGIKRSEQPIDTPRMKR